MKCNNVTANNNNRFTYCELCNDAQTCTKCNNNYFLDSTKNGCVSDCYNDDINC